MATRRMFSIRLINSAKFLKMPISSQALYFHLGLHADDDGIVEAFPVMRYVGCTEDDLRVLMSKGFVQVLNDDLVAYITDWNEHNKIRADRKIDSIYKDLLIKLNPDVKLIEKRKRADAKDRQAMDGQRTDDGQSTDGIGKVRLGKVRLGKDSIGEDSKKPAARFIPPTMEDVEGYCRERKNGIDPQRFIDYYTSNGWKVGKNPMKDWKAAIRTWEKNGSQSGGGQQAKWDYTTHANPVKEEIISFDDWGN